MDRSLQAALLAAALALPSVASAHERQVFRVGDRHYAVVVGFANEPVFVGDKSGFDLRVRLADPARPLDFGSPKVKPVEKLETALQVEISAGSRSKVFPLEPAYRDPGLYRAHFYPTAAAAYRFRVFGKLNDVPVELTFTCNEDGRPAKEDRSEVKVSDRVTRVFRSGSFACPQPKDGLQFP